MNVKSLFFVVVISMLGAVALAGGAQAQTAHENCYLASNKGSVGQSEWTGCAVMYIVNDIHELISAVSNGYKITHNGVDYTFADSTNNIFTGEVESLSRLFELWGVDSSTKGLKEVRSQAINFRMSFSQSVN